LTQPSFLYCEWMKSILMGSRITRFYPVVSATLLLVMIFFAYSNTFFSPPILDDFHAIFQEQALRSGQWSVSNFLLLSQTKFGLRRWIPMLTFSWDTILGQGQIWAFHLTNLVIHGLCALGVLFLCFTLIRHVGRQGPTGENPPPAFDTALWITALWALNPVQTNAVTYLVQRMASLSTLFAVLCVGLYASARCTAISENRTGLGPLLRYAGSLLCLGMAFLSKENAFMIPVLLLFTEAWFFRPHTFRKIFGFACRHYVIASVVLLIVALACYGVLADLLKAYDGRHFTLGQRVMTQWRIILWYVSILLWPGPGRLSLEHDVAISTSILQPVTTLFSFLFLAAMTVWVFYRRKTLPLTTYGLLWFLLNLSIESSIIPLELVFEHRLYLPSIGFALAFTLIVHRVVVRLTKRLTPLEVRKITWSAFAILASVLSLLTFQRNLTWEDSVTLNRDNVAKAPLNPRSHTNLAVALSLVGEHEEAFREANIAIGLGQENFEAYCESANIVVLSYIGRKEYQKAAEEGERLIAGHSPRGGASTLPLLCLSTALAYKEAGDLPGSYRVVIRGLIYSQHLTWRSRAVTELFPMVLADLLEQSRLTKTTLGQGDGFLDPGDEEPTKTWIAQVLLTFDHWPEAKALLTDSLAENPQDALTRRLLEQLDRDEEKSRSQQERWSFWRKYVRQPYSRFNLCMAAAFLARTTALPAILVQYAEQLLDYALTLEPNSADAILLKGWYHYQKDETEQAIASAHRAIALESDSARAWLGMGFFLIKAGLNQEALAAFRQTLELYPRCPERLAISDLMSELYRDISTGQKSMQPSVSSPLHP
jgi:protein O-mannosyl-transferase